MPVLGPNSEFDLELLRTFNFTTRTRTVAFLLSPAKDDRWLGRGSQRLLWQDKLPLRDDHVATTIARSTSNSQCF
jgi:hypothetical protein